MEKERLLQIITVKKLNALLFPRCTADMSVLYVQRLPRRLINAPAKLIFPAGGKLLKAGNSRSYAMNALKPYLNKVGFTQQLCMLCPICS